MNGLFLGIISIAFCIALALASFSYFGDAIQTSRVDAQATNYLNQQSQLAQAIENYQTDKGRRPNAGSTDPVDELVASKYLKTVPPGGETAWQLDAGSKALLAQPEGDLEQAMKVCVAARRRANMPDAEHPLKCDGSSGDLLKNDPCCLN